MTHHDHGGATHGGRYTCREVIDLLAEYCDGALGPAEREALAAHLAACPPCVDFLHTYEATPRLARAALDAKMPAEMKARLADFLAKKLTRR